MQLEKRKRVDALAFWRIYLPSRLLQD